MGAAVPSRVAYAEYLVAERARDVKHEYLDGIERAMAGGTIEHGRLASRFDRLLGAALGNRACEVFSSDVRVRVQAANRSFYPDLSVVCGRIERAADDPDAIVNPVVIVEVLSERTEGYDRGEKFRHYRRVASLRKYVLVAQDSALVEVWRREGDTWRVIEHGAAGEIELVSLDAAVSVDELYRDPLAGHA